MSIFDFITDDEAAQQSAKRFAEQAKSLIQGAASSVSNAATSAVDYLQSDRFITPNDRQQLDEIRKGSLGENLGGLFVGRGPLYEEGVKPLAGRIIRATGMSREPGEYMNYGVGDALTMSPEAAKQRTESASGVGRFVAEGIANPASYLPFGKLAEGAGAITPAAKIGVEAGARGVLGGTLGYGLAPDDAKVGGTIAGATAGIASSFLPRPFGLNSIERITGNPDADRFAQDAMGIVAKGTTSPGGNQAFGGVEQAAKAAAGPDLFPMPKSGADVPPADQLGILQPIEQGLTGWDKAMNWFKWRLGVDGQPMGIPANEYATPATRAMDTAKFNISSQAARLSAIADSEASKAFTFDKYGRIQGLTGNPTIQDLAAKLPLWADELTPEQQKAMDAIWGETQPFLDTLKAAGVDIGAQRPDIIEGGFYLPRGRADIEGELPRRIRGGSGRGGSKMAEEKSARFDSMTQGIDAGYEYVPFREAMQALGEHVGNRSSANQIAEYFRNLTDEAGIKIGKTQHERLLEQNGDLALRVGDLRLKIDNLSGKIQTALRRGRVATNEANRAGTEAERQIGRREALLTDMNARSDAVGAQQDAIGAAADQAKQGLTDQIRASRTLSPEQEARFGQQNLQLNSREQAAKDLAAAERRVAKARTPEAKAAAIAERDALKAAANDIPRPRFNQGVNADANQVNLNDARKTFALAELKGATSIDDVLNEQAGRLKEIEGQIRQLSRRQERVGDSSYFTRDKSGNLIQKKGRALEYGDQAQSMLDELQAAKQELSDLRPAWDLAKERAQEMPRGQSGINFSQLQGMSFPDEIASVINRHLESMKPATGKGAFAVHTVDAVNNLLRGIQATGDLSFAGIQGLMGFFRSPKAYTQAMDITLKAAKDEGAVGTFLRTFDERAATRAMPTSRDWQAAGLHFGGRESEFFARSNGAGIFSAGANKVRGLPGLKQSEQMFGAFGDVLRHQLAETFYNAAKASGKDVADEKVLKEIAKAANLMTGFSTGRAGGGFGGLALFAPRFFQSQLELLTQSFRRGTVTSDEARRAMLKMVGGGVILTAAVNEALGNPVEDWLKPWEESNGKVRFNPNFMRMRIPGVGDVTIFGPWDSLLKGVASTGLGAAGALGAPTQGDPTAMLRTKASPSLALAWNLISGTNALGEDARSPEAIVRQLLPFGLQQVGKEPIQKTALGLTGLKVAELTPTEHLDQVARDRFGKKFYDLEPSQRAQIKDTNPDLWQNAVEKGPDLRKQVEQLKGRYYQEQIADDKALQSGEIDIAEWRDLHGTRQKQLGAALEAMYSQKPQSTEVNTPLDAYFQALKASKQPNGEVDWDQLDAWLASQPKDVQDYIDRNTGLNGTPFARQYRQAVKQTLPFLKEYQNMPAYVGLSVEEGKQVAQLVKQASSLAQLQGITPKQALMLLLERSSLSPDAQYVALNQRRFSNPERRQYWQEHAAMLEPVFGNLPLQEELVTQQSPLAAQLGQAIGQVQ